MGSSKKDSLNIFIDSCVLLAIYDLSGPDLDEFKKIAELAKLGKLVIYMPEQVTDEFWRNREGGVADALKKFKETKVVAVIPNLVRSYEQVAGLQAAIKQVDSAVRDIVASVEADIGNDSLKADKVVSELLHSAKVCPVDEITVERAKSRVERGNPPGKKGSVGDAINWETLLKSVPEQEDLSIISGDGDYKAPLSSIKVKEFLSREWKAKKKAEVKLYASLPKFLQENFPEIKLSDEVAKTVAIERLESSGSYNSTHFSIYELNKYSDFRDDELEQILRAYLENGQVLRILEDEDVMEFAQKLVKIANERQPELVAKLQAEIDGITFMA